MALKMLVNAIHPEECRVALIDNGKLLELEIERADQTQLKGNIYKAAITRIEPSLQAAFLDIGSTRNGFLQINDINPTYYNNWPPADNNRRYYRPAIQDVLEANQELVVQVVKDERDAKGATLTTNLSIPGRYLVLMVGNQRGGVSRKIADEMQRRKLRQAVNSLVIPPGMGVIVRTAGINKSSEELQADLEALLQTWKDIVSNSYVSGNPRLLYEESDLACRMLRDFYNSDVDEILVDEQSAFEKIVSYAQRTIPSAVEKIKLYSQPQPLFSYFLLDPQVDAINKPEVILPSGGSIVIAPTEAVVAIDVNSGRSTGQADVEETAFATNKEAARSIAEQLRLRDLGGLIVIDFIDMLDKRHKITVEKVLKDAVRNDKAKVEVGRISKFGLLEMSRQRLKTSLASQSQTTCPTCNGRGRVKTSESAALEALRKIQAAVFAGGVSQVRIRMAPAAALLLLNNKRQILTKLEEETQTKILIFADGRLRPEDYELEIDTLHSHVPHTNTTYHPQAIENQKNAAASKANRYDDEEEDDDDENYNNDSQRGGNRRGRNNRRQGGGGGRYNNRNNRRQRGGQRYGRGGRSGSGGNYRQNQRRNDFGNNDNFSEGPNTNFSEFEESVDAPRENIAPKEPTDM